MVEWNHLKEASNRRKHGVSFELAQRVFQDPSALLVHDRVDFAGEDRWRTVGRVASQLVLMVAYVLRREYPVDVVRILSARRASRQERQPYDERVFELGTTVISERACHSATAAMSKISHPLSTGYRAWGRRTEIRSARPEVYICRIGSGRRYHPRSSRLRRSKEAKVREALDDSRNRAFDILRIAYSAERIASGGHSVTPNAYRGLASCFP